MDWEEILWKRSWANVLMLLATIPKYESSSKEKTEEVEDFSGFDQLF